MPLAVLEIEKAKQLHHELSHCPKQNREKLVSCDRKSYMLLFKTVSTEFSGEFRGSINHSHRFCYVMIENGNSRFADLEFLFSGVMAFP